MFNVNLFFRQKDNRMQYSASLPMKTLGWIFSVALTAPLCAAGANTSLHLVGVQKIWDHAPHNAFTDLIRFQNRWFCVFREGQAHVSPDGALRILTSVDGEQWKTAARMTSPDADLRDAKITVTPRGELMLSGAAALHDQTQHTHRSLAWFSRDGSAWSDPVIIGDPDFWLWRVTWQGQSAYSIGYSCGQERSIRLYASQDGRDFDARVPSLFESGYPNETSIVFDGDIANCLLRRDGTPNTALLGTAKPPYTAWVWQDLGVRLGGPHMIHLPDGRWLAAGRLYDGAVRTSLCWIDRERGELTECLKLPSGGDTSYPGLVWHDGLLWVSYYASHEGKTAIYLAKVRIGN